MQVPLHFRLHAVGPMYEEHWNLDNSCSLCRLVPLPNVFVGIARTKEAKEAKEVRRKTPENFMLILVSK